MVLVVFCVLIGLMLGDDEMDVNQKELVRRSQLVLIARSASWSGMELTNTLGKLPGGIMWFI